MASTTLYHVPTTGNPTPVVDIVAGQTYQFTTNVTGYDPVLTPTGYRVYYYVAEYTGISASEMISVYCDQPLPPTSSDYKMKVNVLSPTSCWVCTPWSHNPSPLVAKFPWVAGRTITVRTGYITRTVTDLNDSVNPIQISSINGCVFTDSWTFGPPVDPGVGTISFSLTAPLQSATMPNDASVYNTLKVFAPKLSGVWQYLKCTARIKLHKWLRVSTLKPLDTGVWALSGNAEDGYELYADNILGVTIPGGYPAAYSGCAEIPITTVYGSPLGTAPIDAAFEVTYDTPDGGGVKRTSASVNVTVTAKVAVEVPLTAPTVVAASQPSRGITLTMTHAMTNVGFKIYRRHSLDGTRVLVGTTVVGGMVFIDKPLDVAQTYYYKVSAYAASGEGPLSAEISATPGPLGALPTKPVITSAEALDSTVVRIRWTVSDNDELGYVIQRGSSDTGPWQDVGSVGAGVTEYVDNTATGGAVIWYTLYGRNDSGDGPQADPVSVETPAPKSGIQPVSPFTLTPGCRMSMCQVAGRVLIFSDLDRPIVYVNRKWFQQGLKPLRNAPVVSTNGSGKMTGTVAAYVVLYRSDGNTRSIYSPVSNWLVAAGHKIKIALPAADVDEFGTLVCRDSGYDQSGNQISGCDFWEVYLTEQDLAGAYLVARVPITQADVTVDYAAGDLIDATHRPMETKYESLIPPACAYSVYRNSRVYIFCERTIKPNDSDNAALTINNGSRLVTAANFVCTDALYHKELYINKSGTGWFVVDVVSSTTLEIRHADPEVNGAGFTGSPGVYNDFAFAGKPSRVYASAYFSGEAAGGATFSPETYPPDTIFEEEFDPDDNQDGNGAIASRDAIFFFKPSKAFFITGGETPDFPMLGVTTISRGSGLLAPKTLCRDRHDNIYYLSDQGPHMAHQGGVEKVGTMSGNAFLFQRYFDVAAAVGAVGTWFSRDDYFVCFGLNRKGRSGARDAFIFDSRTSQICPQTTLSRITSCVQTLTDSGDYQLLVGDEAGYVGTFLTAGVYSDLRYYGAVDPLATEEPVPCYIHSSLIAAKRGLTPQWFVPRMKVIGATGNVTYTVGFDGKNRSEDPNEYSADVSRTVTTAMTNRVRVGGKRMQNCVVGIEFDAPADGRVEWNGLEVTFNIQGTS